MSRIPAWNLISQFTEQPPFLVQEGIIFLALLTHWTRRIVCWRGCSRGRLTVARFPSTSTSAFTLLFLLWENANAIDWQGSLSFSAEGVTYVQHTCAELSFRLCNRGKYNLNECFSFTRGLNTRARDKRSQSEKSWTFDDSAGLTIISWKHCHHAE